MRGRAFARGRGRGRKKKKRRRVWVEFGKEMGECGGVSFFFGTMGRIRLGYRVEVVNTNRGEQKTCSTSSVRE